MKRLKTQYGCPVELALDFVGGKWKTLILARLKEAPCRYAELRAHLPGISDKVLTERLKDLERLELVEKRPAATTDTIIYHLTDRGESLRPVLNALYQWGAVIAPALPVTVRPA
jgi:DNA-binding HxlR family transcriptional regulator